MSEVGRVSGAASVVRARVQGLWSRRRGVTRGASGAVLRRAPLVLGLFVLAVGLPLARMSYDRTVKARVDNAWTGVRLDAQTRLLNAAAMLGGGAKVDDGQLFVVPRDKRTFEALGQTDLEPPLFKLAEAADSNMRDEWFSQQGRSFASFTRTYDDKTSVVALVDMGWWGGYLAKLRVGLWRWMVASVLALAVSSGLLTRLLLRPARRALRERIDFLADAAHELRTPLSVIQASSGHALARARGTEDYVQALVEIRSAAGRASDGVTELLDLARFDAGQVVPRLAPLRLDLLAEEIAVSTRVDGCEVHAEIGPSVLVNADMALLRQAIDNVVRNAASRASNVTIRCCVSGTDGVLAVVDDGPGFAAEQLPYVFERYRRGDHQGSLGLGLPIAASIVSAHGGRIEVTSPNPTVTAADVDLVDGAFAEADTSPSGATVTIRLPRSRT
jgi:signal transduction histidine kinase